MNKVVFLVIFTALCVNSLAQNQESFGGLGMSVRISKHGVEVAGVLPNSPASYAGLQIGDVIISADGATLSSTDPDNRLSLLRVKPFGNSNLGNYHQE